MRALTGQKRYQDSIRVQTREYTRVQAEEQAGEQEGIKALAGEGLDYVFAYDSVVEVFYLGRDKKVTLTEPFPLLSIDRMSTIRFRLAKQLGVNAECVYAEIHFADRYILPFYYFVDEAVASHYKEEIIYRPPPREVNTKREQDVYLGPLVIPKALFSVSKRHHRIKAEQFVHVIVNYQQIAYFADKPMQLKVNVLVAEQELIDQIQKYRLNEEHAFAVTCYLMKYFPFYVVSLPNYVGEAAFVSEQKIINELLNKLSKELPRSAFPSVRFHFKTISILHQMNYQVDLRSVFNELSVIPGVQFIKYVYKKNQRVYSAIKCSINDQPTAFDYVQGSKYCTEDCLLFGVGKGDFVQLFASGHFFSKKVINFATNEAYTNEYREQALHTLQKYLELVNSLPSQFTPLEIKSTRLVFSLYCNVYLSYAEVYPIHALRAISYVLSGENVDSSAVIKSNAFSDSTYYTRMQYTSDYLMVEYDGVLTQLFFFPFVCVSFVLAEQFSKHSSTHVRYRDYYEVHDPELYNNLKQRYSKLCQGNHKPLLTSKEGPNTYKYWNFTTNLPQLYRCPEEFPHLYFITGKHRLNYCVPCCSASKGPRQVVDQCLADRTYDRRQISNKQYIIKKENVFQLNRSTVLPLSLSKYFEYANSSIFCITLPEYVPPQLQLLSLAKAVEQLVHQPLAEAITYLANHDQPRIWMDFAIKLVNYHSAGKVSVLFVNTDSQEFYSTSFNQYFVCVAVTKNVFNPIYFGNKSKIPISSFKLTNELLHHINQQMTMLPDQVIDELQPKTADLRYIVDREQRCRYLIGTVNKQFIVHPVIPQYTDRVPVIDLFPDPSLLLHDYQQVKQAFGDASRIQFKVIDEQGSACGFIANGLFFPSKPSPSPDDAIQVYDVHANPLVVNNYLIACQRSNGSNGSNGSRCNGSKSRFDSFALLFALYVDYLYELISLQNPVHEQDVLFLPLNQLLDFLRERAKNTPYPAVMTSCRQDKNYFFCSEKKLVLADFHKDLVKHNNIFRKTVRDAPLPLYVLIADIEFKCGEYEQIYILHYYMANSV